jgi:hypothetical protein
MIAAFDCGRHFMSRSDILLLGFAEGERSSSR